MHDDRRSPAWTRTVRVLVVCLLGVSVGLGFGMVAPAQEAQALAPAPAVTSLSSELVALMDGGFTASEAAGAATATGVAAGASAATYGSIVAAGAGAFFATAQGIGFVTRAVGGSTKGLCDTAGVRWLAGAYGEDCGSANLAPPAAYKPNTDEAYADIHLCRSTGECFTVHLAAPEPVQQYNGYAYGYAVSPDGPSIPQCNDGACTSVSFTVDNEPGTYYNLGNIEQLTGPYAVHPGQWSIGRNSKSDADALAAHVGHATCFTTTSTAGCSQSGEAINPDDPTTTSRVDRGATDPLRVLRTTVTYQDGTTMPCDSVQFHESDGFPQWCMPGNPDGKKLNGYKVQECIVSTGDCKDFVTQQGTSDAYQKADQAYPDCSTGTCVLRVQWKGDDCTVGADGCVDWRTTAKNTPDDIRCLYGTHVVDLSECAVLSHAYDPASVKSGHAYSDPSTGDPTTEQTSKPEDGASGAGDEQSGTDCLGETVNANPATWVTGPVICALRATFVPDPANIAAKQAAAVDEWNSTQLAKTADSLHHTFEQNAPADDCSGFKINFDPIIGALPGSKTHGNVLSVANACQKPLSDFAALCRLGLIVIFGIGGIIAVSRYIGKAVNYGGVGGGD